MNLNPHVAIVGATGAVGGAMLAALEKRSFPIGDLTLLASSRSTGKRLRFHEARVEVKPLSTEALRGIDLALFSAGGAVSRAWAPRAVEAGATVIDNSSAFRMDDSVPLVIPEINPADLRTHQGVIANPNCTTAVTLMALFPLHQAFKVTRVFASSYQAVSGTGARAIEELDRQVRNVIEGKSISPRVYPHPIAFNVLPQVDSFLPNGYTKEEMKLENEGRKIMHHPRFKASVTCVRVPVYRAHSIAVSAEFQRRISAAAARKVLSMAPGIELVDEPETSTYPFPLSASGQDDCQVGRIREDCALENGLSFWVAGDQLLKGAALNAVQIAELLLHPPAAVTSRI